jgi:hypothetical protein
MASDLQLQRPGFGEAFRKALMEPVNSVGFAGFGEVLPRFENMVEIDKGKADVYGIPTLKITMSWRRQREGDDPDMAESASEMLEAAGARTSSPGRCTTAFRVYGIHEMGVARMGKDKRTSVLNQFQQTHDVDNLYVIDAAGFTSGGCQNPTLTIMALTVRSCDYLMDEMKKGALCEAEAAVAGLLFLTVPFAREAAAQAAPRSYKSDPVGHRPGRPGVPAALAEGRSGRGRRRARRSPQAHALLSCPRQGQRRRSGRVPRRRLSNPGLRPRRQQIALMLNEAGISAFVVQYRVGPRYRHPVPLEDAQRAIRLVRSPGRRVPDRPGSRWGSSASPRAGTCARPRARLRRGEERRRRSGRAL